MKYLGQILYGIIIAHWLLHVKERLVSGHARGRFVIVGMHSSKDEFIVIGRTSDATLADTCSDYLENNSVAYIALCYDMCDPADRWEFDSHKYTDHVEDDDEYFVEYARGLLCNGG